MYYFPKVITPKGFEEQKKIIFFRKKLIFAWNDLFRERNLIFFVEN